MRILRAASAVVLTCGLLLPAVPSLAANPPVHQITTESQRTARDYSDGLRSLHLGELEEAIREFQQAIRREPNCAMAHWGLSRALDRAKRGPEALAASTKASETAAQTDDLEQRLISAWASYLKAQAMADPERGRAMDQVRRDLNLTVSLYPDDPEVWILRGEVAESPLRRAPFYLAALRLAPDHPLGKVWKPEIPPVPALTPAPTQPVAKLATTPKLFEGLGKLSHPVTTSSPECQSYYEQGLRCFHSYVMPARCQNGGAQCFQYAANLDPECAMAYWGLSFCPTDAIQPLQAANRALELALKKGTDKERRFTAARVLELTNGKREEFLDALDAAIAAYPDDVELWTWRGKVFGAYGFTTGSPAGIPYQLAALRIAPDHPSPNHEMVHAFEALDRPALGWRFTEGFRRSAPNMPHANHMQAHLATRIGRWQDAIDATRMSRKKSLEGFPELDPSHHIDILIRALAHEGRFKEAESEPKAYRDGLPWARLLQLKGNPTELAEWAERRRGVNAVDGFYIGALVELDRGNMDALAPMMANVEDQFRKSANNNFYRFNEVKGRYLIQTGKADEGLKMLREAGARAVKDPGLHAWGGGSYMLEVWGEAALRMHRWDEAEEAFHEALAHEHGSIIGALGMQVVWEQRNVPEMARHYAERAAAIWKDADPGVRELQLERLRKLAAGSVASSKGAR